MNYHFITIEGNIGSGKTTLAHILSKHFNARLILEQFADNPFLPKFYENPGQYAFPLELFFMAERYKQLKEQMNRIIEHRTDGLTFHYKSIDQVRADGQQLVNQAMGGILQDSINEMGA